MVGETWRPVNPAPTLSQAKTDVSTSRNRAAPATQWWRQLAIAIVSGLTFATLLTLLITPAALMLREDTRMKLILRRMRRAARNSKAAPILQNLTRAARGSSS